METVWITGASSGIGEACAYRWAAQGARLILTSSSRERLEPVAARCREAGAADVCVLPCDLGDPTAVEGLAEKAWDAFQDIDTVYLAGTENELTAVRMILTGRLAGVPSDTIRERLRDLYA